MISLTNVSTFSLNPLLEIRNAYIEVRDSEELKGAIDSISKQDDRFMEISRQWPESIRKMFDNVTDDPDKKFFELISEKVLTA